MAQTRTSSLSTWTADSRSLACQTHSGFPHPGLLGLPDKASGNSVTALSTSVIMPLTPNTFCCWRQPKSV